MDLLDRYRGALVGVHVGDSLGAPFEAWPANRIRTAIAMAGGLKFFDYVSPWVTSLDAKPGPAGRPTDDSDQTADLCHSLIACGDLDTDHLRESLRGSVIHGKSRLWDGRATGSGATTQNALSDDPERVQRALENRIGTNGSLMRSVPMALWFGPREKLAREQYKLIACMSSVTHAHHHSVDACKFYVGVLCGILAERPVKAMADAYLRIDAGSLNIASILRNWNRGNKDFPYDPGAWPARGSAEFSLYVALHILLNAESFAEGIEMAIRIGGDTDTYAAIVGGLLGALYGYDAIPLKWKHSILGHNQMIEYAQKLYEMRMST